MSCPCGPGTQSKGQLQSCSDWQGANGLGGPWTQPPELPPELELELVPPELELLLPQRQPHSHWEPTQRSDGWQPSGQKSVQSSGPHDPLPLLPLVPALPLLAELAVPLVPPLDAWPVVLVWLPEDAPVPLEVACPLVPLPELPVTLPLEELVPLPVEVSATASKG